MSSHKLDVNVRVFGHLLDEHHVELLGSSDDELELEPERQIRTPKPNRNIEVKFLAPQPIVPVGVPVPEPEPEPDAEADAVNNLLCEIPESVDFLPSGLNAKELGFATIPVIKGESEEENQIGMGIYLSTPKTDKFSEDGENGWVRYGLSSMQGWRATMEGAHAAYPDLDASTSLFGVYDGHGGKVVAKFCAKYLHRQVLKNEAYAAGDIGTSVKKAFFRMDEMMRRQRGWRELAVLGDEINKFTGMIEGLIWSPRSSECKLCNDQADDWAFEEGPHSDFSGPTSGSTACVAIIRNKQLVVANAGDSRCVISRKGQVELHDDDEFMVIACDGIWDCMTSQQVVDFVHEQLSLGHKLSVVVERIFDQSLAASTAGSQGCDNMTMILVQFKKPVLPKESADKQESPTGDGE